MENRSSTSETREENEIIIKAVFEEEFKDIKLPCAVEDPYLLLFGGFQGSGKTTAINGISAELDICILSHDRIRHKFLNKTGFMPSSPTVNDTKLKLLNRLTPFNVPITVDANTTPAGITAIRKSLTDIGKPYRIISVFLDTPKELLKYRVINRRQSLNLGMHLGTLSELQKTLQDLGEIDKSTYDLILNTEALSAEQIVANIKEALYYFNIFTNIHTS